jgi:hypothetical protein
MGVRLPRRGRDGSLERVVERRRRAVAAGLAAAAAAGQADNRGGRQRLSRVESTGRAAADRRVRAGPCGARPRRGTSSRSLLCGGVERGHIGAQRISRRWHGDSRARRDADGSARRRCDRNGPGERRARRQCRPGDRRRLRGPCEDRCVRGRRADVDLFRWPGPVRPSRGAPPRAYRRWWRCPIRFGCSRSRRRRGGFPPTGREPRRRA